MNRGLANETKVIMYNLGERTPGEYRGIIRGVSSFFPSEPPLYFYIIEMIDRIVPEEEYPYNHISLISSCVKEG